MTFPTSVSVTESNSASVLTSHTVSYPATVNAGDGLILLYATHANTTTPSASAFTAKGAHPSTLVSSLVAARVADGTEGGNTFTVTQSVGGEMAAQVYRITGWFGTLAGIEAEGPSGSYAGSDDSPDPPSFNPSGWGTEDTLWIAGFFGGDDDATVSAYPTNYTDGVDTQSGGGANSGCEVGSAVRQLAAASDDPGVFTLSEAEGWFSFTIAVRPARLASKAHHHRQLMGA